MGRIADMLRDTGATTLDVDLRLGSYEDRSQYRNVVTANGTPTWSASERGWGLIFNATSRLVVPASATINGPKSVAMIADASTAINRRIFSARSAATDLDLYTDPGGGLGWYNGTGSTATTLAWTGGAFVLIPQFQVSYQRNGIGSSAGVVTASGNLVDYWIGSVQLAPTSFYSSAIRRAMLFNRALSSVEAQALLQELLTERVPTKVYSTQAYVPSGTTRQVVDDYDFSFAPVTFSNTATANSEIPGIPGMRLISGSVKVTSQPKALGCTAVAAMANYDTRSRSKRFSVVWTNSTIDVGWASVRGLGTATGQNGYWVQVTSGGQLRITKSLAGVETVLATDGTLVSGVEYDVHASWNSSTGLIQVWTRRTGQSDWTLACSATDTDVTTCAFNVMYMVGSSNKFTRRYTSINEPSTPWTWG